MVTVGCLLAFGCGPKLPQTSPVSGKVTVAGQPVTTGRIMFQPENGRPAIGAIEPDGTYRLTTFQRDDGAVSGKHRVTIEAFEGPTVKNPTTFAEEVGGKGSLTPASGKFARRWIVPETYAQRDSSPLTAEVKPGTNTIDFKLP
jgi:hypothetical protein